MVRGRVQDGALIDKIGWPCLWYPNVLNPQKRYDGTQEWGGTVDDSRGYIEEVPEEIEVFFHAHSGDRVFDMGGAWERGTASAAVDANIFVADQERIVPQDHSFPYKMEIVRGSGTDDTIRSPWLDEILILRDASQKYTEGTDFELSVDVATGLSTISWLSGGQAPAEGERYAVKAMIFPVWRIKGIPQVRGWGEDQLPWGISLVRDDVAVRGGA